MPTLPPNTMQRPQVRDLPALSTICQRCCSNSAPQACLKDALKIGNFCNFNFFLGTYGRLLKVVRIVANDYSLERSGPEVRSDCGVCSCKSSAAGRCACYLGELSVQIGKHGWGLLYPWKVVIILFFQCLIRRSSPEWQHAARTYSTELLLLTRTIIMEFRKNVVPFPSILEASNHQP